MNQATSISRIGAGKKPGADGFVRSTVDEGQWIALAEGAAKGLHDLVSLWSDGSSVRMALIESGAKFRAIVSLPTRGGAYPSVGQFHAPAIRLERAMRDLHGTLPKGLPDRRPWLDHGAWPKSFVAREADEIPAAHVYPFLPVEGAGLHQIPVGPVHAGIIEPGHFRFTANGEAVVRLEARLGYAHKGVEALCEGANIERAGRIAARISGDSTVAYGFAFALAVEAALDWKPPARAQLLRGVMAEVERLSHHVNDVGAICNDASVVAILARCTLIREDILATAARCFGHRMMMDRILPGGVSCDLAVGGAQQLRELMDRIEVEFAEVVRIYDGLHSLADRTVTTGVVGLELVKRFAAGGHVGRASGRLFDARGDYPYAPYERVNFSIPTRTSGDVDARVWVRIEEVAQSRAIIAQLLAALEPGPIMEPSPTMTAGEGAAMVEAFRGDVLLSVRLDAAGRVARLHARDASWFQWPLLEAAIESNIVADFPLCNKSFNCSYSGHDS
jgi:Ni,Fe-hydrogenase III large subunit